jgi:photosystem II stability/assembly factor-like uncharacterized protein
VDSGKVADMCSAGPSAVGPGTTTAQLSIAPRLGARFGADGKQIELPNIDTFASSSATTAVIGTEAGLFRTADAGKAWTFPLRVPNGGTVTDLSFLTADTGFVVVGTSSNAGKRVDTVYRTVTAGRKWSAIPLP